MSACSSSEDSVVQQVTPIESAERVANNEAVIIDVRTVNEWNDKHIAGAKLIPISDLKTRMGELEQFKGKQLIMQCAVGGRSSKAVEILQRAGFENVVNMTGGIKAWEKAQLPLE